MVRVLISVLVAVSFLGCKIYHYKKVAADDDVTQKKKNIISPWVSFHFPVQERRVSDTTIQIDTIRVDDSADELYKLLDSLLAVPKDSAIRVLREKCVEKVVRKVYTIRDTTYLTDGASLSSLRHAIVELQGQVVIKDQQIQEQKDRNKKKDKFIYIAIGLFAVCLFLVYAIIKW